MSGESLIKESNFKKGVPEEVTSADSIKVEESAMEVSSDSDASGTSKAGSGGIPPVDPVTSGVLNSLSPHSGVPPYPSDPDVRGVSVSGGSDPGASGDGDVFPLVKSEDFHYIVVSDSGGYFRSSCSYRDSTHIENIIDSPNFICTTEYYTLNSHVLSVRELDEDDIDDLGFWDKFGISDSFGGVEEDVDGEDDMDDEDFGEFFSKGEDPFKYYVIYTSREMLFLTVYGGFKESYEFSQDLDDWFEWELNNTSIHRFEYTSFNDTDVEFSFGGFRPGILSITEPGGDVILYQLDPEFGINFDRLLHVLRMERDAGCQSRFYVNYATEYTLFNNSF